MELTIRPAFSDADYDIAIQLQREFLAWREICYGSELDVLYKYDHPLSYEPELAKTREKYGAPSGAFLLAEKDGAVLGGVGLRRLEPSVCEMKRLWVRDAARGLGLGRKLALALMEQGKSMGCGTMRLDTGFRQPQAIAIYNELGFRNIPAYYSCPPDLEAILIFMERGL